MKKILFNQMRFVYSLVWQASPEMIIWQSVLSLLQVFESFLFGVLFIRIIVGFLEKQYDIIYVIAVALTALLFKIVIAILNSIYSCKNKVIYSLRLSRHINMLLYQKALSLDLEQYENKAFFDKYYRAVSQADSTMENVLMNGTQLICNTLAAMMMVAYVAYIDSMLLLLVVIPLITTAVIKYRNKIQYDLTMENLALSREMDYTNRVAYLKDYALELRLTDIFLCLKEKYLIASKTIQENDKKYGKKLTILRFISEYILTTLNILFSYLYIGWQFVYRQNILLGDFTVLVSAVSSMNYRVSSLLKNIYAMQESILYIQNMEEYLNEMPRIEKNENGVLADPEGRFSIQFEQVSFHYGDNDSMTLRDINIRMDKGEKIAIVGLNGSGKSTFIKLLLRLYDVNVGSIRINDTDIKSVNLDSYRNMFVPVFQDYKLFAVPLADNIAMGTPTDMAQIDKALMNVGLADYVKSLKKGIYSDITKEISDDGVILSGGQAQKLALSRCFASKGEVLIFDEPSASLDPKSEFLLFENIYKALDGKTVIFVSHRLTSTIRADKIIMFDKGRIVECGTHGELMKRKGQYFKMFNIQAQSYGEGGACQI